jgi:radical SAM superfamily enzyme YgiQ (UPF0313 family)
MIDIVIISVPGTISKTPPAAPALLKASVESNGFTCKTLDFNIRLYQEIQDVKYIETYFTTGLNIDQEQTAIDLTDKWAKEISAHNPRYVGISVFTYQNRIATTLFCKALRKYSSAKIILGGQGLASGSILEHSSFGQLTVESGLADFWIRSEGELSLVELLKNNITYPGINSDTFQQIDDLDLIPFPNYDNYDLVSYDVKALTVTGSRGCVRACTFCDIHDHWKYRYRKGHKIVEEILYLKDRYGIQKFDFSDSLINGNLKEFKKLIKILSDHNEVTDKKITWASQFIVRSEREVNEEYWQLISRSGGHLSIGVESGSDSVRSHMNKRFSNQDLDYTMSMLDKYNITCIFLMIVGYPTETDADFQQTLDMFTKYQPLANRVIRDVNVGSTLGILPGTPLYKNAKLHNIEIDKFENNWLALDNQDLTLEKRLQRRVILKDHLEKLGYQLHQDTSEHMVKMFDENKALFQSRLHIKKILRIRNTTRESNMVSSIS